MNATTVLIIAIVIGILGILLLGYVYLKETTLDEIRKDVYQLFLRAEHEFTETEQGKQKMEWVVQRARALLPSWAQLIISEKLLMDTIQFWFDAIKDLLDDGKLNKSS